MPALLPCNADKAAISGKKNIGLLMIKRLNAFAALKKQRKFKEALAGCEKLLDVYPKHNNTLALKTEIDASDSHRKYDSIKGRF